MGEIIQLSAPKKIVFIIAVVLFVLAVIAQFVPAIAVINPWAWIIAFVLLAAGNLLNNF